MPENDELLDLDSELAAFEAEWEEPNEEVESTEPDQVEETHDDEVVDEQEQQETPNPNDTDEHRRNQAFAKLREEAEANRKYAEFINRLAEDGGVTPEEILNRYQERQLQTEAEKQQVPVEFLKESRETKSELTQLKEQLRAERMNTQIESVISKYSANDDDIRGTFEYMMQSGVDPRVADNVDFEKFYRAAHLDTIIQKEVETARQKDLENKKQRQNSAAIGNGTSVSPSSGELSDDEFDAELARLGIKL